MPGFNCYLLAAVISEMFCVKKRLPLGFQTKEKTCFSITALWKYHFACFSSVPPHYSQGDAAVHCVNLYTFFNTQAKILPLMFILCSSVGLWRSSQGSRVLNSFSPLGLQRRIGVTLHFLFQSKGWCTQVM